MSIDQQPLESKWQKHGATTFDELSQLMNDLIESSADTHMKAIKRRDSTIKSVKVIKKK